MERYKDDGIYHIYNKGINGEQIFLDESNYKSLIRKMIHNYNKYDVNILAFCLMPDHYHLLLQQKAEGSITDFLEATITSYESIIKQQNIKERLFDSDPKYIQVKKMEQLQYLIWYIHYNPIKAGLVRRIEKWPFTNYLECTDLRKSYPYDLDLITKIYGSQNEYKIFVEKIKDGKIFDSVKCEYLIDN